MAPKRLQILVSNHHQEYLSLNALGRALFWSSCGPKTAQNNEFSACRWPKWLLMTRPSSGRLITQSSLALLCTFIWWVFQNHLVAQKWFQIVVFRPSLKALINQISLVLLWSLTCGHLLESSGIIDLGPLRPSFGSPVASKRGFRPLPGRLITQCPSLLVCTLII